MDDVNVPIFSHESAQMAPKSKTKILFHREISVKDYHTNVYEKDVTVVGKGSVFLIPVPVERSSRKMANKSKPS